MTSPEHSGGRRTPDWTFCPKCGTRLTPGAEGCLGCGTQFRELSPGSGVADQGASAELVAAIEAELREILAPGLQLLKSIGQGGMGIVYLARDPALRRNVVIKVLAPWLAHDPTARARFEREAQSAAAVAHPNVVGVFQVGTLPKSGTSYFVMQHVEGQTLEQAFPHGTVVAEGQAKRIIGGIANALAAAHRQGLVHRDIKAANVMLEAETERVVVLDFGISAAASPAKQADLGTKLTQTGMSVGTPTCMSPEQVAGGDVTEKSDIYSLGVVAFELLAGRPLFEETTAIALMAAHLNKPPPLLRDLRPDLDPQLCTLIAAQLEKDATKRPSAATIARALTPQAQAAIEWPPPGLQPIRGQAVAISRRVLVTAVLGAIFLALLWSQPQVAGPRWWEAEGSWFWRAVNFGGFTDEAFVRPTECAIRRSTGLECIRAPAEVMPLWLTALLAVLLLVALNGVRIAVATWRLTRSTRQAERVGYPAEVVRFVAWDGFADTAHLMNLSGPYVLHSEEERSAVSLERARALRWCLGAIALGIVVQLLWLFGVARWGGSTRILSTPELIWMAALLAFAVAKWIGTRPHRMWVEGGRSGTRAEPSATTRDLAAGWMRAAPSALTAQAPFSLRVLSWAAPAVAGVTFVVVVACLTLAGWQSLWNSPTLRAWVGEWRDTVDAGDRAPSFAALDEEIEALIAAVPVADTPSFDAAAQRIFSLTPREVPPGPNHPPRSRWDEFRELEAVFDMVRAGRAPTGDTAATIAHADRWATENAAAFEAIVRAIRALPDSALGARPLPWIADYMMQRHGAAARRALAGDRASATRILLENLVLARYMLHSVERGDFDPANVTAIELEALGVLAERDGEAGRARELARLAMLLTSRRYAARHFIVFEFAGAMMMADPHDPIGARYVGRTDLMPMERATLADGSWLGFCANGREVLFGPAPERHALAARSAAALSDLPAVARRFSRRRFRSAGGVTEFEAAFSHRPGVLGALRRGSWCTRVLSGKALE